MCVLLPPPPVSSRPFRLPKHRKVALPSWCGGSVLLRGSLWPGEKSRVGVALFYAAEGHGSMRRRSGVKGPGLCGKVRGQGRTFDPAGPLCSCGRRARRGGGERARDADRQEEREEQPRSRSAVSRSCHWGQRAERGAGSEHNPLLHRARALPAGTRTARRSVFFAAFTYRRKLCFL